MEALSIVRHSTDKLVVKKKMRATFEYSRSWFVSRIKPL